MRIYFVVLVFVILASCQSSSTKKEFSVKNKLDIERTETVSILLQTLDSAFTKASDKLVVVSSDGKAIPSQLIDMNSDGRADELIFQTTLAPNQELNFSLEIPEKKLPGDSLLVTTYSRLVPERIDDYAWENDLVAFRTYGPEAQRLVDAKEPGGTLSSGLDCWLKRVDYPVINKWYKKYVDGGTYHKDDGEGYDPYHVGGSRGCGGIGVWKNDSLYVSKNFVSAKTIAKGPIRTVFELTYAPWQADGITVNETKRISLDLGSQLTRVEVLLNTSGPLPNVTIGVTLHNQKGIVHADTAKGYFSYWEPVDDSEIGTGVVIDPKYLTGYEDYRTKKTDLSQLHIITKPVDNKISYYEGFGWKKAGVIFSAEEWNAYLDTYAQRLASPLEVTFK